MDPQRDPTIDFDPGVWRLFDEYVHGQISRRAFLDRAQRYAVGAMTASAMLALLSPRFAEAQQVRPDDARLRAEYLEYPSPDGNGTARGYLVRPAGAQGRLPAVLVAHENRGLNPHIEDVTRRLALEGYLAFAPDALYPLGGYPGNEDAARAEFQKLDQAKTRADFLAAARLLLAHPESNGKLGATGFCWGGGLVNWLATELPELKAGAPYYGMGAPLNAVPKIEAELLVVLAADDPRINVGWDAYAAALASAGVEFRMLQPPGTQHGFHNDTTPRYNADAAAIVWRETLALFARRLRA
jgi:carboxymethylenebutenolidase